MTKELASDIAAEVRAEISRQKKTQIQIAEQLGMTQPQISERMRGVTEWRISELVRLAEWLEVPLDHFVPARRSETVAGAA